MTAIAIIIVGAAIWLELLEVVFSLKNISTVLLAIYNQKEKSK